MKLVSRLSLLLFAFIGLQAGLLALFGMDVEDVLGTLFGVDGFTFAYPWVFLALIPLVPLGVMAFTAVRRRAVGTMVFTRNPLFEGAPRSFRQFLRPVPPLLRILAIIVLCMALARPQAASVETLDVDGIDIYVLLDMSGSMQAIDLDTGEVSAYEMQGQEPPNRFDVAQDVLRHFVHRRADKPWFDRIGMVIFARQAFLQFPLTVDYTTVLWLLGRLELEDIDPSETAIGNALGLAISGLIDSDSESKVIILITDGDERGGNISAVASAEMASDNGIQIYPILVGREGPVYVPVQRAFGRGLRYDVREGYPVDAGLLMVIGCGSFGRISATAGRGRGARSLPSQLPRSPPWRWFWMLRGSRLLVDTAI